jgi:hypothetical protein
MSSPGEARPGPAADSAAAVPGDEPPVPSHLAAGWLQAEAQLYPAVIMRPDLYQRAVLLVSATVEQLRTRGSSTAALLDAAAAGQELVAAAAAERRVSVAELDLETVGRAAVAMRHREVVAEQAASRRLRLLAAAASRGQAWVVLEESGDSAGDPFRPYQRLEAHPATGRALLVTAGPDEEFRSCRHAVEVVHVDPSTGQMAQSPVAGPEETPPATAAAREERAAALRDGLAAL